MRPFQPHAACFVQLSLTPFKAGVLLSSTTSEGVDANVGRTNLDEIEGIEISTTG